LVKDHPVFKKPEDDNAVIWRYLDFTKFVSLIDRKALFFCRSDLLGDPFEGSFAKLNQQMRPIWYGDTFPKMKAQLENVFQKFRYLTFLNCWNQSEYESDAMWKLYLDGKNGIAIQSTYKKLVNSFDNSDNIYVGEVLYIDYDKAVIPENNLFWPYVHKRKSFEHEKELRAVIQDISNMNSPQPPDTTGIYVPVSLETLIENIYVSPTSQDWFDELVRSILKKYKLKKSVKSSKLSERPVF